jgi:hypothetical protein
MSLIVQHQLDAHTNITWATPTSGFGHVDDEQPLPYVHHNGNELTPRFGGEESILGCKPSTIGLPFGVLDQPWPIVQDLFNLPRRRINIYWREIFHSCSNQNGDFIFLQQLNFKPVTKGFIGISPLLHFYRQFTMGKNSIQVEDCITFKHKLRFSVFHPVVLPLFTDWHIGNHGTYRLINTNFKLQQYGEQQSSSGCATVWSEQLESCSFQAGERLERSYTYHWTLPE